jgi:serine/threonine-protein kinase
VSSAPRPPRGGDDASDAREESRGAEPVESGGGTTASGGFWSRVRRMFGGGRAPQPPAGARRSRGREENLDADPEGPPEPPADEVAVRRLLERLADGDPTARTAVTERDVLGAIGRLFAAGRERTALELLGRLVAALPDDLDLVMRLADVLCDRRDDAAARPLLERLLEAYARRQATAHPHALKARLLLADLAERAGDTDGARVHLEALLAIDLDYPRARAMHARLRPRAGASALAAATPAAPTIAGLPEAGAFAGRYRLVRELGRGASGAVYVARDEELDRPLAIKILHPHTRAADRAEARTRAFVEARVAASVRHPGVVAIYDLDEERQLLAMELCEGGSLKETLARGPLPPAEALARAAEILRVLDAVHRRAVVHGDVKPANLLFRAAPEGLPRGRRAELVLGDFGLARLLGEGPAVDERSARGTLAYLPAEGRRGEISPPVDVYAAGVIAVELLAGTAALAGWLGDRAGLLRGTARWDGSLPAVVEAALSEAARASLRALLAAMLDATPGARPTAEQAATAFTALAADAAG